jgi:V/A-type H+-transporting ATPase subunit I
MTKNNQYAWVLIVALLDKQKEVNNILESLYFEPIAIPKIDEEQFTIDCESTLGQIYGYVRHYAELAKYYKYMAVFDDEVVITGFVPKRVCKAYKTLFGDLTDVVIQDFPAESEEGLEPPTVLRNNWFARPFELFIEMYGLPHYGDFDPTFYVAITYSLLFGIMFGDLGQGLVLVIGGFALWKWKKMTLAAVAMRIGLFSMFFGTMFGSFFGDEEILTPFFTQVLGLAEKPFHVMDPGFTMTLLLSAVSLGATLILVSIFLNIVSRIKKKDWAAAFFSQNGLAGFIFYGSAIGMATSEMLLQIPVANQLTIGAFIIVPLLIILMHVPLKNLVHKVSITPHEGWGGYLVESIFELLEIVLSFVTNTMSFLRVGGFVLSHAGMMVVVMTLKEMTGSAGLLVLIIGNIFVIALEGLIVGIQTLRLQYYEMFSRYFEGGGKKYIPTTLLNQ